MIWLLLIKPWRVWKIQTVPLASLNYKNQGLPLETLTDKLSRNYKNAFYRLETYVYSFLLSSVDTDWKLNHTEVTILEMIVWVSYWSKIGVGCAHATHSGDIREETSQSTLEFHGLNRVWIWPSWVIFAFSYHSLARI